MSFAKNTIVIRSVVVMATNINSNIRQLVTRGVGVSDIWNGAKTKLVEINRYRANEQRRVELKSEMAVAIGDTKVDDLLPWRWNG